MPGWLDPGDDFLTNAKSFIRLALFVRFDAACAQLRLAERNSRGNDLSEMKAAFIHSFGTILLLVAASNGLAQTEQVIPKETTFVPAWSRAGYPGEIPSPARLVDVRKFGAKGDGKIDDGPSVKKAIASLGGQLGVVHFPTGVYLIQAPLQLASGVVLRGDGPDKSVLRFDFVSDCIRVRAAQKEKFQPVKDGFSIHSRQLRVENPADFRPGDYAEIRQANDPAWNASSWARDVVGQILRVESIEGNLLRLETPFRFDYQKARQPEIRRITPMTEVGVENLKVERLVAGTPKQRDNQLTIGFQYAARCWVRGVEGSHAFGGHVGARFSTQIEVTGCYFHHAHDYDGGGSGYGVRLEMKTGDCLIENNIFQSLRHSMLVQAGANGNVFGYNYSREPKRTEFPSEISSDITLHGNHPYANLFEGNICQHIWIDSSHGANGPFNTIFRNRAESYGLNMTDSLAHRQNLVGNEVFKGTWGFAVGDGYSPKGNNHFEHGNLTQSGGIEPPGTGSLPDVSYYLTGSPSGPLKSPPRFWSIPNSLPVIGPPNDLTKVKTNPARERFLAGKDFTVPD